MTGNKPPSHCEYEDEDYQPDVFAFTQYGWEHVGQNPRHLANGDVLIGAMPDFAPPDETPEVHPK
jgi:hypothetical protein